VERVRFDVDHLTLFRSQLGGGKPARYEALQRLAPWRVDAVGCHVDDKEGSVATVEKAPGFIRQDGKEKVTGTGRYTADLNLTGMAHAKFRYADHPHARILGIDTSKASALPGVVA